MKLSIIIATFNRGPKLLRTLQSLAGQTVSPAEWEVVAVDNNSADDTAEVFARFAAEHPSLNLRMVAEPRQGLSWARNRGIAEARGDILAIIDDDEEVNPEFVAVYLDFFARRPGAAMAGGRVVPVYETGRPRWMSRWTERPIAGTLDLGPREKPFARGYPAGGNLAVKRWVTESYGAFDTSLGRTGASLVGGEEKEFFVRVTAALRRAGGGVGGGSAAVGSGGGAAHSAGSRGGSARSAGSRGTLGSSGGGFAAVGSGGGAAHSIDPSGSSGGGSGAREAAVWWVPGAAIFHIIPAEKLTLDYFCKLSIGVGRSERIRVTGTSGDGFGLAIAIAKEAAKWGATLVLAAGFVLVLRPSRARYLIIMRAGITRGLLGL